MMIAYYIVYVRVIYNSSLSKLAVLSSLRTLDLSGENRYGAGPFENIRGPHNMVAKFDIR